jgi:hypothetical protein
MSSIGKVKPAGLAGAGLRAAQHVAAHQHDRDGLLLDRRRVEVARFCHRAQDRLGQAEVGEGGLGRGLGEGFILLGRAVLILVGLVILLGGVVVLVVGAVLRGHGILGRVLGIGLYLVHRFGGDGFLGSALSGRLGLDRGCGRLVLGLGPAGRGRLVLFGQVWFSVASGLPA